MSYLRSPSHDPSLLLRRDIPEQYMDVCCKVTAAFNHEEAKEYKEIYIYREIHKVVKANHKKMLPQNLT